MKVIIMSGIPGSGKSAYVERHFLNAYRVCSADKYFMKTGKYVFAAEEIGKAHAACLRQFASAVYDAWRFESENTVVVVDNTNTTVAEIAPYYELATAYGHDVEIVTVLCDPIIAAKRNQHNVPPQEVDRAWVRLTQRVLPKHWVCHYTGTE